MNSRHPASIFEIIARNDSRSCASRSAAIRPSTFFRETFLQQLRLQQRTPVHDARALVHAGLNLVHKQVRLPSHNFHQLIEVSAQ